MASDTPKPDRCAVPLTEKVGLEVSDSVADETYHYEDRLVAVRMAYEGDEVVQPAHFEDLKDYHHSGYVVTDVYLCPDGDDPSDYDTDDVDLDPIESVEIEDDEPEVRYPDMGHRGYCERYPMDNGKCYNHGGASTGPKDDPVNNMTHGLRAMRSNYYEQLDREEKVHVEQLVESWLNDAPFEDDNMAKVNELYRIAVDQLRLWNAQDELRDGIVVEKEYFNEETGEVEKYDDENPANLPYDRLDRTTFKKLKDLGVLDDPDTQNAEATESLAQKFADIDT